MSLAVGDMVVLLKCGPLSPSYREGLRVNMMGQIMAARSGFHVPCWSVNFPELGRHVCGEFQLLKIDPPQAVDWDWRELLTDRPVEESA